MHFESVSIQKIHMAPIDLAFCLCCTVAAMGSIVNQTHEALSNSVSRQIICRMEIIEIAPEWAYD